MRKLKIFLMNHWVTITVAAVVVLLVILTIVGLRSLESFYARLTLATIPLQLLMTGLNAFVFVYFYTVVLRGGIGNIKKSALKPADVNVLFKDVIGLEEAKREAWEVVELIKDRARVKKIGGKVIKGLLMVGPPGCGKTLMAKAIATEAGVPFISIAGSEFVEVFVGVGASRVRKLFKKARQLAYANGASIVFIDELDVIGRGRTFSFMGAGEETNGTQNQLLVEMDGLGNAPENVIVIGATNASEDILDKALLRPGRFDRKIYVGRPDLKEREALFRYYLSKVQCEEDIEVGRLARKSVYKTPAEIEAVVKEAALISTRKKKETVGYREITEAIERLDLGIAHRLPMTDRERERVAYHETGHLMVLWQLHPTNDVFKASIISRGGALGVVHHNPREELYTADRDQMMADVKVAVAGYVAELVRFGVTSSGVSSDFTKATQVAHTMVWRLGMGGDSLVGDFTTIPDSEMSNELKDKLNRLTHKILSDSIKDIEAFLRKEWTLVERFARELLAREELEYDDIEAIFNECGRPRKLFMGVPASALPEPNP